MGDGVRVLRRLALWVGVPLVVVLVAGWTWYRVSDTGKRWRYEDRLSSYCDGVLPVAETSALTGLSTDSFRNDLRRGGSHTYYEFCWAADLYVTVSRIPGGVRDGGLSENDLRWYFPYEGAHALPSATPLGGGWRGYTDVTNTVAALTCRDGGSLVVTAQGDGVEDDDSAPAGRARVGRDRVQRLAELTTATAARAAGRWGCGAKVPDGPPAPPAISSFPRQPVAPVLDGACAGIGTGPDERIDWAWTAKGDRNALEERCVLGTDEDAYQGEREGELYRFSASYGPSALEARLRSEHRLDYEARHGKSPFRASASCPGDAERARFTVAPYHATPHDEKFATVAFRAFVQHAVERHGCGDLRLPD
ncbi:hypothetical protein ACFRAO_15060 [Streptomyces sp. NPDC056656]|uniref:hypothetical protein n=1 Tax=Streptomyces sp. NPDC056656 TaxID=3345895 RepID=UPI0036B11C3E